MLVTSVKLAFLGPIGFEDDLRFPILPNHERDGSMFIVADLVVVSSGLAILRCRYQASKGAKMEMCW
jgi:hypothetical protein